MDHAQPNLINRASLSEQAYAAIKQMIIGLELQPGEPITEAQLSEMLGLSKSPIRTALVHLHRDGLVTITPYKETIVSELQVETVRHIYEVRSLIEPFIAAEVTRRLGPEKLEPLERLLAKAELALAREDYQTFFHINTDFHGFFAEAYDNPYFWTLFQSVDYQMQRIRMLSSAMPDHPKKQMHEHVQILEAVRSGEPEAARKAMHDHIVGYYDDLMREMSAGRLPWFNENERHG